MRKSVVVIVLIALLVNLPSSSSSADETSQEARWERSAGHPLQEKELVTATSEVEAMLAGYVFVPINPFRTWDSRNLDYYLQGGYVERFNVLTDQYNIDRIPYGAVAVTYNLTVTSTFGEGFLSIYPVDIDWPGTSSINWTTSGQTIANGGVVAIGDYAGVYGGVEVYVGPNRPGVATDYIIDITGYYI